MGVLSTLLQATVGLSTVRHASAFGSFSAFAVARYQRFPETNSAGRLIHSQRPHELVVGNGVVLHAVTDENGGDNAVTLELAQYRALAAAHSALLDTTQVCKRPLS
jgi:hypothetical protein